jgi:hypothetical protein
MLVHVVLEMLERQGKRVVPSRLAQQEVRGGMGEQREGVRQELREGEVQKHLVLLLPPVHSLQQSQCLILVRVLRESSLWGVVLVLLAGVLADLTEAVRIRAVEVGAVEAVVVLVGH